MQEFLERSEQEQHPRARDLRRNAGLFKIRSVTAALLLAGFGGNAPADLARVGPADIPSPSGNGFPLWYQDLNGTVLDLCLPDSKDAGPTDKDPGKLQQNACLLTGIGVEPPYAFPSNFPEEAFFYHISTPSFLVGLTGASAMVELALEAAFGPGAPQAGQQMVFSRLRIRAGVPAPGTYTVTHPYGVETFHVDTASGNRDINFTDDVGVAPGVFTDALKSRLGPFLRRSDAPGGPVFPPTIINGAEFLSDGATPGYVTGSPFNTNYVMICGVDLSGAPLVLGDFGPDGPGSGTCAGEMTFVLVGRLHNGPIGSPLAITRATYGRDAQGTHVDVNANVVKALPGQPNPILTAASANQLPVTMTGPTLLGDYYAQGITDPTGALPNPVTVINSADSPPTALTRNVVDVVSVISADYNPSTDTLKVRATSSDKGFGYSAPPSLILDGFPSCAVARDLSTPDDPSDVIMTASGIRTPPASVAVVSSAGGIGRADVIGGLDQPSPFLAGVVFAQDDNAAATAGGAAVVIPVLANDIANPTAPAIPSTVSILNPGLLPADGSLTIDGSTGSIRFTPSATVGVFTVRYTVGNMAGTSNPATLTLNVAPGPSGPTPIANADPGPNNVNPAAKITLNVLANDSGNGGTLNPASLAISGVTGGTAVANADGTVDFTAGTAAGIVGFDYTVANTNGNRSTSAHVTVTVAQEQIALAINRCTRSGTIGQWNIRGTDSVIGGTITLYASGLAGSGSILGTAPVTLDPLTGLGTWTFRQNLGTQPCRSPISLRSNLGTTLNNVAIRIQ